MWGYIKTGWIAGIRVNGRRWGGDGGLWMTTGYCRRRQGMVADGGGLSVNTGNRDEIQETMSASGFERRIMIPGC